MLMVYGDTIFQADLAPVLATDADGLIGIDTLSVRMVCSPYTRQPQQVVLTKAQRRGGMDTLDVTGLPEDRVRFLRELVALWRKRDRAEEVRKLREEDLPPLPDWWREALEEAKSSPLARMTEEEIGQLTEEWAERGRQRRLAQQAS
ncbi:MAG: hypothetical protein AB1505_27650 [Candidatus Latescibacterota bacterium]